MTTTVAAVLLGVVTIAAAIAGAGPFAVVVVVLAVVLLLDFAGVLSSAGPRPVVLAAAVPGVALPAVVVARPGAGWEVVPDAVAGGVIAAFVMLLVFGRRRDVTGALGATLLVGLVVGLGATGLLLLRALPDGTRWVLGVVLAVAAVDTARQAAATRAQPRAAAAVTVAVALVAGGILLVAANPPFVLASAAGVAAVALLAAAAAGLLREAVDDAVASVVADGGTRRAGEGIVTSVALPVLLAAPSAYALARLAAL